jgi:hypothetical protein
MPRPRLVTEVHIFPGAKVHSELDTLQNIAERTTLQANHLRI